MTIGDIATVVRCWKASGASTLNDGATLEELQAAERSVGRPFPDEFVTLYQSCNGADVLEGNINLYPLDGAELSVVRASDFLRASGWPIPPELVILGGNGQGDCFGLWVPATSSSRRLVVEVGAIFEEGSLSVAGTSLSSFLRGRTAYYLLLLDSPRAAREPLAIPSRFRAIPPHDLDDEDYDVLLRWADPELPELPLSPYDARLTAEDVKHLAQTSG